MLSFKQFLDEAFTPNFSASHSGWEDDKHPDYEDEHYHTVFRSKKGHHYQVNLDATDPKKGHHLSFGSPDKKIHKLMPDRKYYRTYHEKTDRHEFHHIINSVFGLAIKKAKEEPSIRKVRFSPAYNKLGNVYDGLIKSKSFHRALDAHGFVYRGKEGEYHVIEKK